MLYSSHFTSFQAEDKDIGKNAKMAYTIIQGNDNGLFWINSSSGELFLVAPLTVTANDTIELVVEVVDTFSTNTSFQDTTVVRMTFYGRQLKIFIIIIYKRFNKKRSDFAQALIG